jgi:hypothetical protein
MAAKVGILTAGISSALFIKYDFKNRMNLKFKVYHKVVDVK